MTNSGSENDNESMTFLDARFLDTDLDAREKDNDVFG